MHPLISDNVFGVRRAAKPGISAEEEQLERFSCYLRDEQDLASG